MRPVALDAVCFVVLFVLSLVEQIDSSSEDEHLASPSFRASVRCGAQRTRLDAVIIVTSDQRSADSSPSRWRGRTHFRNKAIVATSRQSTRLVMTGSQHYNIYIVKQNAKQRFPSECGLFVEASQSDMGIVLGSVEVNAATTGRACRNGGGVLKRSCNLWRACSISCRHNACQFQDVNQITTLDDRPPAMTMPTVESGPKLRTRNTQSLETTVTQLAKAKSQQRLAASQQRKAQRALRLALAEASHSNRYKRVKSSLRMMKYSGQKVWDAMKVVTKYQKAMMGAARNQLDQNLAANKSALSHQIESARKVLDLASKSAAKYAVQQTNMSSLVKRDKSRAALKAKVVGEAEASLKLLVNSKATFSTENQLIDRDISWLKQKLREAKERFQRLQVDAQKWKVQMEVADDAHTKKQTQLKHSVAVDLVQTARIRLNNFKKKLEAAREAFSKAALDMNNIKVQEKHARHSWTLAERQWSEALQQVREDQSEKLKLQKMTWKNQMQLTSIDLQQLLGKQASLNTHSELQKMLLQKDGFALDNAKALKLFYQTELGQVRASVNIHKRILKQHIAAAAQTSAKAKASSMALAAAESEAMRQVQHARQSKQIEKNARRVALLRAESVARLTERLNHAATKEVHTIASPKVISTNPPKQPNSTQTQPITLLRFRLDKAKRTAVAAVKEAHKYSAEQMQSQKELVRLQARVQQYHSANAKETQLAVKSQLLLDKIANSTDLSVATLSKVKSRLIHAIQEEAVAKRQLRMTAQANQKAKLKQRLAYHKDQVSNALFSVKEAEEKTKLTKQVRHTLNKNIAATQNTILRQVNIQAEAHVDGHACLVALERARSSLSVLKAKREEIATQIETTNDKQTQEDDHVSELRIKAGSASHRASEHSLIEKLKSHKVTVLQLQKKLEDLSRHSQQLKVEVLKKTKETSTQDALLANALAKAKAAREEQLIFKSGLRMEQVWSAKLHKSASRLRVQLLMQKKGSTQLTQKAADELLRLEESRHKDNYDTAAMQLKQKNDEERNMKSNLTTVKHRISELQHAIAQDVQKESDDDGKAQHFLMGASDARSIVEEDTSQRGAEVNKIRHLQNKRNELDQTLARSLQRKNQVASRLRRLAETKKHLRKSQSRAALLLTMHKKELKRGKHLLLVNANSSVWSAPSSRDIKTESQLAQKLEASFNHMQKKDNMHEQRLALEEHGAKSVMQRAEKRFNKSRSFWEQSKRSLAQVENSAQTSLKKLRTRYETSVKLAHKADQVASTAVTHLRNPEYQQQDIADLQLALQQAHLEAQLVQNHSNTMIRQALDLVASEELNSLETKASSGRISPNHTVHNVGIIGQAQTKVAISALNHAHKTVSHMKVLTEELHTAQKLWSHALSTTQHAVALAHRVMISNQRQWDLDKRIDVKKDDKYQSVLAKDLASIQNLTRSNSLAIKGFEKNTTASRQQKFQAEMAPYNNMIKQQLHRVQQTTNQVQQLELQLARVRHEEAKDMVLRKIILQKVHQVKQEHNLTLAQLKAVTTAESSAESAVKYATHTAHTLASHGDKSLLQAKDDKHEAQQAQIALQKALDVQREYQIRLAGLTATGNQDQSRVIQLLASWRLSQAARQQAPLILRVAGLATSSKIAHTRAHEEVAVMQSNFRTLRATISKYNRLQQKCNLSKGKLKAAKFRVQMSVEEVADYHALQLERDETQTEQMHATGIEDTGRSKSSMHHLDNSGNLQINSISSEAVQEGHMVVSRKLQMIGACRKSKELHTRIQMLQQQTFDAEAKSMIQQRTGDHQIIQVGSLRGQILNYASDSKKQVLTTALQMASEAQSEAAGSIKMQLSDLKRVLSSISKSLKVHHQRMLETLVVTGKAAALNTSRLSRLTADWENELSAADIAEAKADLQVMFESNELLSRFKRLKETFRRSVSSGQCEQDAATALADAELARKAGDLKIKQDTCLQVTNGHESAGHLYNMLKTQWGNIGIMAQEEVARVNTAKRQFIQVKRDATVAKDSFEVERANLKKNFSLGQIQLNALRSEASFASAKVRLLQQNVHGAPITSGNQSSRPRRVNSKVIRAKQMLKQVNQKQRTQQQALRRMIEKRIQATVNLTTAATSVFTAEAAISASYTAEKNVKELLSAVSTSVSNLNKEIGKCQLQLVELRRQRETYMGTAYKIITQQKLTIMESTYQFASMQHSVLSMASKSATEVFRIQTSISRHAATKYRVLRAREKLLLKFATYHEGNADKLKHAFVKSDTLAQAETAAHNGASLAEFQHARSNVRGKHNNTVTNRTNNMQSSLSADTAIIAIVDAAQAAARKNAKTLRQQQRNAFTLAARLTLDAKAIRSKIPTSLARIRQTMQNAKTAHTYADKMADQVHHVESVRRAYHTKLLQIRKEVEEHERSSSNGTTTG